MDLTPYLQSEPNPDEEPLLSVAINGHCLGNEGRFFCAASVKVLAKDLVSAVPLRMKNLA